MNVKRLYQQLTLFLNAKKRTDKDIILWYDALKSNSSIDENEVIRIQQDVKKRLFEVVAPDLNLEKNKVKTYLSWSIAAAVALIIAGYVLIKRLNRLEVINPNELTYVLPAQERAIIVLENGEEIDLDKIAVDASIQVGEIRIIKDAQGRVTYKDLNPNDEKIRRNTIKVPKASTYQLLLTDGTKVTLNSDSKLTYPTTFESGDRIVRLDGEAYFEVNKTANRSKFIVEANAQKIEVLGTKFNVKSYQSENLVQTTLEEGAVNVHYKDKSFLLKPNEQLRSSNTHVEKRKIDIDEILSWTRDQFCFDGTNTEEVLQEIARWYAISVIYKPNASYEQYKGKIPRNLSLDRLIELLSYAGLKVKAQKIDNQDIILFID